MEIREFPFELRLDHNPIFIKLAFLKEQQGEEEKFKQKKGFSQGENFMNQEN